MENLITMASCLLFAGFGVFITLYIEGKGKASDIPRRECCAPRPESPAQSYGESSGEQKKAEEIVKQWNNLLSYTGTARGDQHE